VPFPRAKRTDRLDNQLQSGPEQFSMRSIWAILALFLILVPAAAALDIDDRGAVPAPQPGEKALRYYRTGNLLWWVNTAWGIG
jgi:hypothetical protein